MTLREMIAAYPDKFYAGQTWFDGEAFMEAEPEWPDLMVPSGYIVPDPPTSSLPHEPVFSAADLAHHWLRCPGDCIWRLYLWTSDLDHLGQRVFVGQNSQGLEIHRRGVLHLSVDRLGKSEALAVRLGGQAVKVLEGQLWI